jgi:hypothetical protein
LRLRLPNWKSSLGSISRVAEPISSPVTWSEGTCNTPNIDGVVKEPRNYVERAWLGGLTIAEFPKDKVSSFNDMLSVGVEIKKDYYPIGIFGL